MEQSNEIMIWIFDPYLDYAEKEPRYLIETKFYRQWEGK